MFVCCIEKILMVIINNNKRDRYQYFMHLVWVQKTCQRRAYTHTEWEQDETKRKKSLKTENKTNWANVQRMGEGFEWIKYRDRIANSKNNIVRWSDLVGTRCSNQQLKYVNHVHRSVQRFLVFFYCLVFFSILVSFRTLTFEQFVVIAEQLLTI